MNASGNTMVAPTFANVGIAAKFNLKDVAVSGYDPSTYDEEEGWSGGATKGKIVLQQLTKGGTFAAQYYWLDYKEGDEEEEYTEYKGWYNYVKATNKYVKMTDAELEAAEWGQGQAFWMKSGMTQAVSLVPSGAVGTDDVAFELNTMGNTGVGVARPAQLTIGDLTVSGYDPSTYDEEEGWSGGATKGKLVLQTLTKGGAFAAQYYWLDYKEGDEEEEYTEYKGWFTYNKSTNKYIKMSAEEMNAVVFGAGAGFWFKSGMNTAGVQLNVPAVELK